MSSVATASNLLQIDHSIPFDPVAFIGVGWSIIEQDQRSLALTEVDLNMVILKTALRSDERKIKDEEVLRRLKEAGHICLDVKVFQTLWNNQHLIPESWRSKERVYFHGTVVRGWGTPGGWHCVFCLSWEGGEWCYHYDWLGCDWDTKCFSACLAN